MEMVSALACLVQDLSESAPSVSPSTSPAATQRPASVRSERSPSSQPLTAPRSRRDEIGSAHDRNVETQVLDPEIVPLTEESVTVQLRAILESSLDSSPVRQLRLLMDALNDCTVSVLLSNAMRIRRDDDRDSYDMTRTCDVQERCASAVRSPNARLQLEKDIFNHHLKAEAFSKDMHLEQQTTLGLILAKSSVNQLLPGGPAHLAPALRSTWPSCLPC